MRFHSEYNYIGTSDFCSLFTADEWAGFENTLDMECVYALIFNGGCLSASDIQIVRSL